MLNHIPNISKLQNSSPKKSFFYNKNTKTTSAQTKKHLNRGSSKNHSNSMTNLLFLIGSVYLNKKFI